MKFEFKIKGLNSVLDALNVKEHRAIVKGATNTAGGKTFTQTRRLVKKRYNVIASLANMPFTKDKATTRELSYKITTSTRQYNIAALYKGSKQTSSGVRVEVLKGKKALIKGAFISRPSGKDYSDYGQKRKVTTDKDLIFKRKAKGPYPLKGVGNDRPGGVSWAMMLLNKEIKSDMSRVFFREFDESFAKRLRKKIERKIGE